ncbi:hypothetical protein QAD02_017416 [Eretmocerus hayati]|uniref:Uncharacterized protein n=1 Tax=Eretmocerus hayati TaxID=131215 RepID=A0ACC2PDG1_9HYME|nr:hypothetical protein QAD02_017416 [Eretmocerus hayati]
MALDCSGGENRAFVGTSVGQKERRDSEIHRQPRVLPPPTSATTAMRQPELFRPPSRAVQHHQPPQHLTGTSAAAASNWAPLQSARIYREALCLDDALQPPHPPIVDAQWW